MFANPRLRKEKKIYGLSKKNLRVLGHPDEGYPASVRGRAPLFFANAELFQQRLLEAVEASPPPVRRVVVAAEPVTSVDVTSADMLRELCENLSREGIALHFAEMKDPVRDKLKRFELSRLFGDDQFHPTVGSAVDDYLGRQGRFASNMEPASPHTST
jgi:MFS superfamily sulfate permease-like transporter